MKKALLSIGLGLMSMISFAQLSGTYTINSGQATGGTNYNSFSAAVSALGVSGVSGAVTFNVVAATYTESVNFPASIAGSNATNTITFQSAAANTSNPVLTSSGNVINMSYGALNNITFKNLDIIGTGSYAIYSFPYNSSAYTYTDIKFENCLIQVPIGTGGYPVYIYAYFGGLQKWIFESCEIRGGYYGVYAYAYYATAGGEYRFNNCEIADWNYMSVNIYGYLADPKFVFTNNYVYNSGVGNTVYGLYSYYSGAGTELSGNRFELSPTGYGYGLLLYYNYGTAAIPTKIHNNTITYTSQNQWSQYGFQFGYSNYNKVYHNTINITNNYTGSYGAYMYYTNYGVGNEFKNNIIRTAGTSSYNVYAYSGNSFYLDMADNVYSANSGTTIRNYAAVSGNYTTVAAWQAATGGDAGSVAADPSFSSNTNLIPQAIAIDNMCEPIGVLVDIDGLTRSLTTPDPGAHEFSVPTNNAGLTALIAPDAPLCADDTSVVVVLKNTGLVALTTCSLHYELNNTVVLNSLFTGNLAPGADTVITLVANTTFASGSEIRCWSSMPNGVQDSSAAFDTVGTTIFEGLAGTYNIPNDYATLAAAAADVNLKGICGHVVMEINSGTYNEQIVLGNILGSAEDATLTWRSANGNPNSVKIISNTGASVVALAGSDWVTFQDLTIRNTTTGFAGFAVHLSGGAEHVTLENCIIRSGSAGTTSANLAAVYSTGLNHNLTINNCELLNGGMGLYLFGSSTTSRMKDITVTNTLLKNAYYMQSYMYYVEGLEFHNNVVTNDSNMYLLGYGCYMFYVDDFNITGNYIGATGTYFNNPIYAGYGYPMYLYYCVGSNNPRSQVTNNCINASKGGASQYGYYGIYTYYSGLFDFHNNSVNRLGGFLNSYYTAYFSYGGLISLKNNSFADYASGYALYTPDGFTISESENNNFYSNGTNFIYFTNANYPNLTAYQNGTGNDMNGISTDPAWEDSLACVTCNVALDNSGTNTTVAMYDIDSNMRSVNTPDIGAKEWVSPANFTLGGDSTYCADEVTIEAGPAQSVTWSVNGNSSTAPTLTLAANGATTVYNVLVSIQTEFCGSASDNALITLVPNANLDSNTHLCANTSTTLNPGGAATASYTWSTGAATQSIVVNQPGTYSVTKDEQGCVSTASTMITQSEAVQILGTEVCSDDLPLNLDATIANGTSYAWSGGSNPTGAMNTFNDGGAYTVTATDAFGCSSIDSFEVVVLEAPEAVITTPTYSGFIYVFDASSSPYLTSNSTVNWDFGVGASPATSTNVSETVIYPWSAPSAPTTYSVSLEINNGCGIDIATMIIAPTLTGETEIASGQFLVYPNPANDVVNIITNDVDAGSIQVLDMSGRIVAELPLNAGSNNHEINVSDLAAGSYIVKVINETTAITKQLIIQ